MAKSSPDLSERVQPDPADIEGPRGHAPWRSRVHRPLAARRPHSSRACTTTSTRPARALDLSAVRRKQDPKTKLPLQRPADYDYFQINPVDNEQKEPGLAGYISTLCGAYRRDCKSVSCAANSLMRRRTLFADETIDKWRVIDGKVPDCARGRGGRPVRIWRCGQRGQTTQSGSWSPRSGRMETHTCSKIARGKPAQETWGKVATSAYERHDADVIVGELKRRRYGAMVVHAWPRTPFKKVTASRGKVVRAEPISALYEQGKVRHVGQFAELEDETIGVLDRGDIWTSALEPSAAIWALSELFTYVLKGAKPAPVPENSDFGKPKGRSSRAYAGMYGEGWADGAHDARKRGFHATQRPVTRFEKSQQYWGPIQERMTEDMKFCARRLDEQLAVASAGTDEAARTEAASPEHQQTAAAHQPSC